MHGAEEYGGSSRTIRLQSRYRSVDAFAWRGNLSIPSSRNRRSLMETVPLKMNGRGGESR
jgi:hypothetical protein